MKEDSAAFVRDTFSLIEEIEALTSLSALSKALAAHLGRCGVENFAMSRLPPPGSDEMGPLTLIDRWPDGWVRYYDDQRFVRHDPIVSRLLSSHDPYAWADVPVDRREQPTATRIMAEAANAGLVDGYTIPIFDPGGSQGCITMAGRELDLRTDIKRALYMIGLFAYSAAEKLYSAQQNDKLGQLSFREREILRWIAIGRSQSAIAEMLEISDRTVEAHLRNARTKLRTVNTVHTAVVALQRREIRL